MPDVHGPLRNSRFRLEIDDVVRAGFAECHLPSARTEVISYREGSDKQPTDRKLAGLTEYGPLILKGGVARDAKALFDWYHMVASGKVDEARTTIAVVVLDEEGGPSARWEFRNAWPRRYEGPRLDASGECVAIETVEIVNEGFERKQ